MIHNISKFVLCAQCTCTLHRYTTDEVKETKKKCQCYAPIRRHAILFACTWHQILNPKNNSSSACSSSPSLLYFFDLGALPCTQRNRVESKNQQTDTIKSSQADGKAIGMSMNHRDRSDRLPFDDSNSYFMLSISCKRMKLCSYDTYLHIPTHFYNLIGIVSFHGFIVV